MRKKLFEWVYTLGLAVLLSLFVRTYVAEARWVPTESMYPTIKIGDHLLVDKVSYKINSFQRGDVVVFKAPPATNRNEVMVKRLIGLPGDTIEIKNGVTYINNAILKEPYVTEKVYTDFEPFKIPEGSLFMMGDNRNNSYDSRSWGVVPADYVIGKALVCYYPFNSIKLFSR